MYWLAFLAAGTIWGSSFLWIKIGLEELTPQMVVVYRAAFGLLAFGAIVWWKKLKLPRDPQVYKKIFLLSIINPSIPFLLISWAETKIDSSIAAVLNSTVPLFTIVLAHLILHDEKMTRARVAGLVTGFVGILLVLSRDLAMVFSANGRAALGWWGIAGQSAVLFSAVLYGFASVYTRKYLRGISPVIQTGGILFGAEVVSLLTALALPTPMMVPQHVMTWLAVVWLGVMGSCIAFMCYFYVLEAWGATRSSLVNYAYPVVGVTLGRLFRSEPIDWHLILGALLVCAGIGIVNARALLNRVARR